MLNTESTIIPGDTIAVPIDENGRCRNVVVEAIDPLGVVVVWFRPDGVGPFRSFLPHADLCRILYVPQSSGQHKSHFRMSADEIVDNHKQVKKEIKPS
jgi:hypothetical protein